MSNIYDDRGTMEFALVSLCKKAFGIPLLGGGHDFADHVLEPEPDTMVKISKLAARLAAEYEVADG